MTDHSLPTVTTQYAAFLAAIDGRIKDVFMGADPATTSVTNAPTNATRWNSALNRWEKFNGTTWVFLATGNVYAISISGTALVATTANAVPWGGITSKPTTIAGYAISDAAPLNSPAFTGTPTSSTFEVGFRDIVSLPNTAVGATGAQGKVYKNTGAHTVPASVFSADDCYCVYNNSASAFAINQGSGLTLRLVGTASTGNRTLAPRGFATIWFVSSTECVISGGGVS